MENLSGSGILSQRFIGKCNVAGSTELSGYWRPPAFGDNSLTLGGIRHLLEPRWTQQEHGQIREVAAAAYLLQEEHFTGRNNDAKHQTPLSPSSSPLQRKFFLLAFAGVQMSRRRP